MASSCHGDLGDGLGYALTTLWALHLLQGVSVIDLTQLGRDTFD